MSSKERLTFEKLSNKKFISILKESIDQYECEVDENIFADKCFFIAHSKFDQIFMIKYNNRNEEFLNGFSKIDLSPYSIGVPVLKWHRNKFFPTISMGNILAKICKNKITLDESKVEKLTYGKPVLIDRKIEFRDGIAVDKNGDFISYVTLLNKKNGIKIVTEVIPTLDVGWYLREGG
ncbi:hypothetical protein [Sulfuracidifex tepidarius]|uniref:Uncharacterized protein n=1 Tax=Sulfuracidifex tepidarius TaxID=1294262 RepID=A0A510E5A7_9CREN|nr:hypothetical protein [Sulfuracidifex tepidarius]BBG24482.1 hypothetical protein IC006_1803 [Sulfuracidifex tepidarius]BBG27240.1 hypothetical protein IC007_1781 [Sulfuracidifex tepidarius]